MSRPSALSALLLSTSLLLAQACAGSRAVAPAALSHNDAGTELLSRGALDDAEARFRLALEYHPGFAEAHLNLALVLMARARLAEAREHLDAALALHEDYAAAHTNLGVWHVLRSADPTYPDARASLRAAEGCFTAALRVDPGLREPRLNVAELLIRRGAFREARAHLLRLVQVFPEDLPANAWLAYSELRLGLSAPALERAEKVLTRAPRDPVAHLVFALGAAQAGDWEATRDHAAHALRDPRTRAGALGALGAMALVTGDLDATRAYAAQMLELDPNSRLGQWLVTQVMLRAAEGR